MVCVFVCVVKKVEKIYCEKTFFFSNTREAKKREEKKEEFSKKKDIAFTFLRTNYTLTHAFKTRKGTISHSHSATHTTFDRDFNPFA